jgi:hypothetical protein
MSISPRGNVTRYGGLRRLSPVRLVGPALVGILAASTLVVGASGIASATPTGPGGEMTAVQSTATAGSTGNSFDFQFVAQSSNPKMKVIGIVRVLVPADWTTPVRTGDTSGPGFVSISSSSCAKANLGNITGQGARTRGAGPAKRAGPWLVPVSISCPSGSGFTLHYANATVSDLAGPVTLQATFKHGKIPTPLAEVPAVTIEPGPVASLDVEATPSALNPHLEEPHADITGTYLSTISTVGFDQFGNEIGNVDADTTLSISPDGDCGPGFCEVGTGSTSSYTVTATDGAATGQTVIPITLAGLEMSCQGENYDVNGDITDGCEAADSPQGNHTESTAANEGDVSDCDTPFEIDGTLLSDNRLHQEPAVEGFDPASGSVPDWMSVVGQGNVFCQNDLVLNLQVVGSQDPSCYRLTVITDKDTYSAQTDDTGLAQINEDSGGQFSDDTTINFEVQKTCSAGALTENVSYSITGHL